MHKDMLVIDNFYENPDNVRNFAIKLKPEDWLDNGLKYETKKCYFSESITRQFEQLIGSKLDADPRTMGYGAFTFFPDRGVEKFTHYDDNEWVGIVYLIPNELCEGVGLTFCRHKESGLMGPPNDLWLRDNSYQSFEDWYTKVYVPDKPCIEKWEETMYIPVKYNRLVLFRGGRMFHRASKGFGNNAENGRLTQSFFFEVKKESIEIT
ncbi:DUF6445 family protein [Paenibacillus elgii]|uniref:DUF6445 family protein n=1 Tax=Paenibacillus elgii TaxID=189691 RepID=UPI002042413F|nr:DUF6445 family protein [Paenibacillus elgii]MCM3268661.1 DUF6445 family protein [Paenibacillus elgii]